MKNPPIISDFASAPADSHETILNQFIKKIHDVSQKIQNVCNSKTFLKSPTAKLFFFFLHATIQTYGATLTIMGGRKMNPEKFYETTREIERLAEYCKKNDAIANEDYDKYGVYRGLRDLNGKGVLVGLTNISEIHAKKIFRGEEISDHGQLYYRGYNVYDIISGIAPEDHFGFEQCAYLLLFGELPTRKQLNDFCSILSEYRSLPTGFVRDIIMNAPSRDMMNTLARSVLTMYTYDPKSDDNSPENVLRQCLELISIFPLLSVYGYRAYRHFHNNRSLVIHQPDPTLSTAENFLHILRPDSKYTPLEAKLLDIAFILHMEHGGGNNSTFTTRLVSTSGTDTYSAIAAALGSLKGPKHGGANLKVVHMFDDMKEHVKDWKDEEEVSAYLRALLHGEAFDNAGLIYGMGHAIYSLSDPRAVLLKQYVEKLSKEKGMEDEFALYALVEKLAPGIIAKERKMYKGVSANVDFYSGFAYRMLALPEELYTPIFAISRIAGWSAHRMEEIVTDGKIMRPAYGYIAPRREFVPIDER